MAKMLILTADTINAEEALRIGLVEKVVEPEELMPACEAIAAKIASKAPIAVGMAKTCMICSPVQLWKQKLLADASVQKTRKKA